MNTSISPALGRAAATPDSVRDWELLIATAPDAKTLHGLDASIKADDSLHSVDKDWLITLINRQFAAWNRAALKHQKPRWK